MRVTTSQMVMGEHLVLTMDVPAEYVNVFGQTQGSRDYTDVWLPEAEAVTLLGSSPWLRCETHNAFGPKHRKRGRS